LAHALSFGVPHGPRDAAQGIKSFCVFFSRKRRIFFSEEKQQKTFVSGERW
jgi:hypothetical protein